MNQDNENITQQTLFDINAEDTDAGVNAKPRKRWRGQFRFWLDALKPDELELGEKLAELKQKRQFQPTIRAALRLFLDLKAGRTAVLCELFPGIVERIRASQESVENQQFEAIIQKLDTIASVAPTAPGGPKPMNVPTLSTPTFDDDELPALTIRKDTSTASAQNFLASMTALQQ